MKLLLRVTDPWAGGPPSRRATVLLRPPRGGRTRALREEEQHRTASVHDRFRPVCRGGRIWRRAATALRRPQRHDTQGNLQPGGPGDRPDPAGGVGGGRSGLGEEGLEYFTHGGEIGVEG